jgi:hypothetical protein
MSDVIHKLESLRPAFHGTDDDPKNWKSQWEVLSFLEDTLKKGMRSLETGCGYSTVVIASTGSLHTTVTPSADEPTRVRAFCDEIGIDHAGVKFDIGPSCELLPKGGEPLDLVYIDGAHGFPHPCIDWMYTEERLRVGGLMLVDDIRIPTCRILHDFLIQERNWKLERYINDTSIFTKTADGSNCADWMGQGYNSTYPDFSFLPLPIRIAKNSRHLAERGVAALGLTAQLKRLLRIS